MIRRAGAILRLLREARELARSDVFDAQFYRARNADLGRIYFPALHYLRSGWVEGRHPSVGFDGEAYRARYPDVDMADENPALHYLRIGRREGRAVVAARGAPYQPVTALAEMAEIEPGPEPRRWPLVSVIIPSRDCAGLLARCVRDLRARTDYPDLEIIVMDNSSRSWRARRLLQRWRRETVVRVLDFPGRFNWSAMNNMAVRGARGEVLLFLNNDIAVRDPSWLREMAALAMRPDIGAAGTKLLYPNGRVQHAGISLGPGAVARHLFRGAAADDAGPGGMLVRRRYVTAVTGACLAVRRDVFVAVGGMEEAALGLTNGDVDFCLRLRARGLRVIWTPHAMLVHHESATRGLDVTEARRTRLMQERAHLLRAWGAAACADTELPNGVCVRGERLYQA